MTRQISVGDDEPPTKWRHRQAEDGEELYGWDGTRRGNVASAKGGGRATSGGKITDYYDFPFSIFHFISFYLLFWDNPQVLQGTTETTASFRAQPVSDWGDRVHITLEASRSFLPRPNVAPHSLSDLKIDPADDFYLITWRGTNDISVPSPGQLGI